MINVSKYLAQERGRLFWYFQAVGWGGTLAVALGMAAVLPITQAVLLILFRAAFGIILTSFLLRPLYRHLRRSGQGWSFLRVAGVLVLCLGLGGLDALTLLAVSNLLHIDMQQTGLERFVLISVFMRAALYTFWTTLYFGIHAWLDSQQDQLRMAQAQTAMRASELEMLRAQVNPHFLFNALNSILSASGNQLAVERLTLALADYLRFSLSHHGDTEALGVELTALENYLRVEKFRFEDKLEYEIDVDQASLQAIVPVALVQPLLENALKHGQRSPIRPLKVSINCRAEESELTVIVSNTGSWQPPSKKSTGIGLSNLRRRLDLLYGSAASLTHEVVNDRVSVKVRLPLSLPT
jgi:sensor histidine kinase YesM